MDTFSEWVRPYIGRLLKYAESQSPEPEDLVQDTLVSAWKLFPRYEEKGHGYAWLCTVLRHTMLNRRRTRNRKTRKAEDLRGVTRAVVEELYAREEASTPYEHLARMCKHPRLEEARLASEARFGPVLWRVYVNGEQAQDLAREWGLAPSSLRNRVHRARVYVRRLLSDVHDELVTPDPYVPVMESPLVAQPRMAGAP